MKIQCDVCEKSSAILICCADEAALCGRCDVQVHAANKLASKHQRLSLDSLSNKLPKCDICQEKTAFIFCVEDRALFCKDCDEPIHAASSLSANHQRFLATGIRVGLISGCNESAKSCLEPPKPSSQLQSGSVKTPPQPSTSFGSSWAVDDLLQFSEFESSAKKRELEFGELEWLTDMGMFEEQFGKETSAAAEVPQLRGSHPTSTASCRTNKSNVVFKKRRAERADDEDECFTVPDLWNLVHHSSCKCISKRNWLCVRRGSRHPRLASHASIHILFESNFKQNRAPGSPATSIGASSISFRFELNDELMIFSHSLPHYLPLVTRDSRILIIDSRWFDASLRCAKHVPQVIEALGKVVPASRSTTMLMPYFKMP